jgi:hypothetical protein
MAASVTEHHNIEKTEFGPGKTPLYYNNVGLFSDPFLEDRLPNIEKYYSTPSTKFLNDYWNIDEFDAVKFNRAFQDIMDLWVKLDKDISKFCSNERQLQNRWIDKIFEYLGWTIELEETVSRHGTTNFPDYGLYKNFKDLSKSKDLKNKFKKALAVADAKAWGINLDGKGFSNKNPSYQIVNYLKQTDKTWGILTDGRYWRIYSVRSDSKHTTYYEIDLIKILRAGDYERFKYFYNFFRVEAFEPQARLSDRCFLDFVFEDGKFYSQRVESNLQGRVYKVVDTMCKGFLESRKDPSEEELKEVYDYSMYYLFKLMFVLNCESKGLLEVNKQDDYYEFSLRKKCMEIKGQYEEGKNWSSQSRTYNYINDLFELLKYGDEKIGVHGFGQEPFEIGSEDFYIKNKIPDESLNQALLDLSCDHDDEDNLQFIDFKILSPDHIGSLFEGLLEFKLVNNGKKISLENTKGERKATGSYYTPDYMVDYIIEQNLETFIDGKSPRQILNLKILDPSVGSGHFLLGAVRFIENRIVELQDDDKKLKDSIDFDKIRKEVIHNCVFGVDINPLAAQLARFSLWIYSAQKGDELEPLYDQIKVGDSLLSFDWKEEFAEVFSENDGFDAVVGNPPYARIQTLNDYEPRDLEAMKKNYVCAKQGSFDLYTLFFEKGYALLNNGGLLSFITPNTYQMAEFGKGLREFLLETQSLCRVIDFKQHQIFAGASTYSCISFLNKKKNKKIEMSILKKSEVPKENIDEFISNIGSDSFFEDTSTPYPSDSGKWALSSGKDIQLIEKLEKNHPPLDEYVSKIYQGVATSADKVFVLNRVGENKKYYTAISEIDGKEYKIEKDVARQFYFGKDISRYSDVPPERIAIYPYEKEASTEKYRLIEPNRFKSTFPNAYKYLLSLTCFFMCGTKSENLLSLC